MTAVRGWNARHPRVGAARWSRRMIRIVGLLLAMLVAAGCAATESPVADDVATSGSAGSRDDAVGPLDPVGGSGSDARSEGDDSADGDHVADPAEVGANELGRIPVIMYHRIVADGSEYDTSPAAFRAELTMLADRGYRPIRAVDLVDGDIDLPAGTTPVVLTFDDSSPTQFALAPDGRVVSETAVGILHDVAASREGFTPTGSFYVLDHPFGASGDHAADLLRALADLGFEIGNHTAGHDNLSRLDPAGVQAALAAGVRAIRGVLEDAPVRTLSLPFGAFPADRGLAHRGSADGIVYQHDGILLVGSGPAHSPFHRDFDPHAIPRIRSDPEFDAEGEPDFGSGYWLWQLEQEPGTRYVSDGDPSVISFPAARGADLADAHADRANPY
ncbi:MAG: polysaccharide deacetylase family protein [Nitriliruptoraceae bacterium]